MLILHPGRVEIDRDRRALAHAERRRRRQLQDGRAVEPSSVVVAGAPSVPTFLTVAEIVTFSPARALLLDAVIPLTTRSGLAASCTAASASIRPQP